MADVPGPHGHTPYSAFSVEEPGTSSRGQSPSMLELPRPGPSRRPSRTQYEFIMQTGDESSTVMKQKLKTVRSHVMKNYLHHQQQRQNVDYPSQPSESLARRKSKSRTRRSRSTSFDVDPAPTISFGSENAQSTAASRFSFLGIFFNIELGQHESTAIAQPAVPNFGADITYDEVARLARQYVQCVFADSRIRSPKPTYDTLNLKGETVRSVKDTLAICGGEISPSVIFAVNLLTYGCAMAGEWEEAQGHAAALKGLVESCGGIQTVDFELQRTVTWTTYCLSAALGAHPTFSPPLFPESGALSLAFFDEAQIKAWRTVKRFPKNNPFVYDIMIRLHRLGLAASTNWLGTVGQRALSNLYFEAMFEALSMSIAEPWNTTLPNSIQGKELALMFRVWAAALPLFVWATIRQINSRFRITVPCSGQHLVISRIQGLLERSNGPSAWPRGKCLEPILVSLFYCVEACTLQDPWRPWALQTLRKVSEMLKIKGLEEFKKTLEVFPITEEYRLVADQLWEEMVYGTAAAMPSTLDFSTVV